jgi:hypothetical protein
MSVRRGGLKRYRFDVAGLARDVKALPPCIVHDYGIKQPINDLVVTRKGQDPRLELSYLRLIHIGRAADNDLATGLARACRDAIEDATARAPHAENDASRDASARILIPYLYEFHRQDASFLAMLRIERDGAVVVKVGICDVDAMQLGGQHFPHFEDSPYPSVEIWAKGARHGYAGL